MPKLYWIAAIALGLVAFSLESQEQTNSPQDGTEQQEDAAPEQPSGIPVRIIEDPESALTRERREADAEQRKKNDLIAQQRMADATEAMNEATQSMKRAAWWSVAFVGIGTCLLVWTLRLTRQANAAAQGAVDVTREIGEAQVRAYLYVSECSVSPRVSEDDLTIGFTFTIQNAGNSPARNLIVRTRFDWPEDYDAIGEIGGRVFASVSTRSSVECDAILIEPTSDFEEAVTETGYYPYEIHICMTWCDVFGRQSHEHLGYGGMVELSTGKVFDHSQMHGMLLPKPG